MDAGAALHVATWQRTPFPPAGKLSPSGHRGIGASGHRGIGAWDLDRSRSAGNDEGKRWRGMGWMRGFRGCIVWLVLSAVATGCYVERRQPPRRGPPATVQPIGPGHDPAGAEQPKGFHGGSPAAVGALRLPPGAVRGRPRGMHPGAPATVWIWLNRRGQWRVRTTTAEQSPKLSGTVRGVTSGLAQLECSRHELRNAVHLQDGAIDFETATWGHIDGFDFRVKDSGCARFKVEATEAAFLFRILVGRNRLPVPPAAEFELCP